LSEELELLNKEILKCKACNLRLSRTHVVPGIYGKKEGICFIGEAPGYYEDLQGEPFVGRSGKLLDKMLSSVGLTRKKEVSILNIVKCRPTNEEGRNRTPTDSEMQFCGNRWLYKQLELIQPKLIVALGGIALKFFLPKTSVTKFAGKVIEVKGIKQLFVSYHPAYILRNINLVEEYERHFKLIVELFANQKEITKINLRSNETTAKQTRSEQKSLIDFFNQ